MKQIMYMTVVVAGIVLASCQPADETVDATIPTLFNGQNIDGWKLVMASDEVPEQELVTVQDGVLTLHGQDHPKGVIRTIESYSDYELSFEWRWPGKPGNSGLLLHCDPTVEKATWPSCLEAQLMNGRAGEFIMMGHKVQVDAERNPGGKRIVLRLVKDVEKPAGEWNHMRVVMDGDAIQVFVNGQLVNRGEKISAVSGYIALQFEMADIQFRQIQLKPLTVH